MPATTAHRYGPVLAYGKPIPPAYTPAPPSASDSQRMIHALDFIAERMVGIEARLAQLVQIQGGHQ